jgi:hypothetical protein
VRPSAIAREQSAKVKEWDSKDYENALLWAHWIREHTEGHKDKASLSKAVRSLLSSVISEVTASSRVLDTVFNSSPSTCFHRPSGTAGGEAAHAEGGGRRGSDILRLRSRP